MTGPEFDIDEALEVEQDFKDNVVTEDDLADYPDEL